MAKGTGGQLAKSITGYAVPSGNKSFTNVKKVTTDKSAYKIQKGKTKKLSPKLVLVKPGLKKLNAKKYKTSDFRYASTDKSVATVNKKGKIKAVGKGKCDIWIYAINGCGRKVSIVVK